MKDDRYSWEHPIGPRFDWGIVAVWVLSLVWCVLVWLAVVWVAVKYVTL